MSGGVAMPEIQNAVMLVGDAVLYFVALAALLRARNRIGLGVFFCALGVMHFLETYLASIFYVSLPFGLVASPGSTVLFTGKLMMLLLLYIREDAVVVRQPIYGLLFGNALLFALALVMRHHGLLASTIGGTADFSFLDQMGALMIWGTAVLFFDCIFIILLYEHARRWFGDRLFVRLAVVSAIVMTFDQLAFFAGLRMLTGAGLSTLIGGWVAKMAAVALYSLLATYYLRYYEAIQGRRRTEPRLGDVFQLLTYRERYEDLLKHIGCDALTGALDRGYLESRGRQVVADAVAAGKPVTLILIDIDHFKSFNDRFGHAAGDTALKRIYHEIAEAVRVNDLTFRFGGEEFIVIAEGLCAEEAFMAGDRIRRRIGANVDPLTTRVTASVGVASAPKDGADYDALFAVADRRLYQAKSAGRDCVIDEGSGLAATPVPLVPAG
jgi:diguanylate cyclase (GGDEF)-like protein